MSNCVGEMTNKISKTEHVLQQEESTNDKSVEHQVKVKSPPIEPSGSAKTVKCNDGTEPKQHKTESYSLQ